MADLKRKGDLAELMVAADLVRQGHRVALPYGEDWAADLIVERGGRLERVQVKHTVERDGVLVVRARTQSLTGGRVLAVKRYTAADIDWLAAWDAGSGACFYVPAAELGAGMHMLTLRTRPARNNQRRGIRLAADYRVMPMEPDGIEPTTSSVQGKRSPS